ncbi:MAG: glycosyltransferase, partial [Planctomycetota bacterium]
GVDTNEHRVATPEQRAEVRHQLGIDDSTSSEAIAILFVGRISHHAKAQPYPLLVAAQHAAEQFKEKKIHLIFSGWFANEHVRLALESSVRRIAPSVQLHLVDGLDTWWRHRVWDAADIFVSLADSIQETFGLTNLEAMSRGLPVVATDWNGYRDTVTDGLTGFLIPTHMVRESTSDATAELLLGSINYDQFLARIGQTVGVSTTDACQRISQLISDASLRNRFGQAGRERILGRFDWATVIGLYDTMWKQQRDQRAVHQRAELQTSVAISTDLTSSRAGTSSLDAKNATLDAVAIRGGVPHAQSISPAKYPPVQHTFEGYPTEWLDGRTHVTAASSSRSRVIGIIGDRMLNHSPGDPADGGRLTEVSEIRSLLSLFDQGLSIAEAQSKWFSTQNEHGHIEEIHSFRSTVAWMLKYDLLQVVASSNVTSAESKHAHAKPRLSFVTTCKGRLNDLKNTLPRMVEQSGCEVVVVDYNCPEGTGDWVRENYPSVVLVRVPDAQVFDRSDAKNRGIDASSSEWTCLIDADVELEPDFVNSVSPMLRPGYFFRSSHPGEGTGGTFICLREDIDRVGGHDTVFQGWGEEDDDLIDALRFSGLTSERFPASLIRHRDHTDDARTQFHTDEDRRHSHMVNRIYRSSKWDLARLSGVVPPIEQRRALYQLVSDQVRGLIADGKPGVIRLDTGGMRWTPVASTSRRVLEYTVAPSATDTSGTYEPSHQPKS